MPWTPALPACVWWQPDMKKSLATNICGALPFPVNKNLSPCRQEFFKKNLRSLRLCMKNICDNPRDQLEKKKQLHADSADALYACGGVQQLHEWEIYYF